MALSVKHAKVSSKGDGPDPTLVQPSDWNASHNLQADANTILGNNTGSAGPVIELTGAQVLTMTGGMVGSNNLSEITNPATAQTSIGLRIGGAKIFVQIGGSPPTMSDGDICVIL